MVLARLCDWGLSQRALSQSLLDSPPVKPFLFLPLPFPFFMGRLTFRLLALSRALSFFLPFDVCGWVLPFPWPDFFPLPVPFPFHVFDPLPDSLAQIC